MGPQRVPYAATARSGPGKLEVRTVYPYAVPRTPHGADSDSDSDEGP
ncbi:MULTISPECIES: hypothetical protein [unclassified Streptomyces]|nr:MULTISPECIES: hypothetical protein [unclassified Streptomyces]